MINYYEMFSEEITPNMSAEAIWQVLDKLDNIYAHRLDMKSAEKRELIAQALKVFQSEESKRAYDRQLSESRQEPVGPPDPRREELERWKASAQKYFDRKKYDLAKSAIERALPLDKGRSDWKLYQLAAQIYKQNGDYSAALRYINDAIVLEPEDAFLVCMKAVVCNARANSLTKDSRFSSSAELREKYQEIRKEALDLYSEAESMAKLKDSETYVHALVSHAYMLYYSPDQTDPDAARKERETAVGLAQSAKRLGNWDAEGVVKDYEGKVAARKEWTQRAETHRANKEYMQARAAVKKALENDDVLQPDHDLYWLAASIYRSLKKYDTALEYIDRALAQHSWNVYYNALKGIILGGKALALSQDSRFSSSSELRAEYRNLRSQELALSQRAIELAEEQKNTEKQANVMGNLAFALYFRPDAIDPNAAKEERRRGVKTALAALRLGKSEDADAVLKDFDEKIWEL